MQRIEGATPDQQHLYDMIRIRALASQIEPARYAVRTATLVALGLEIGDQPVKFSVHGRRRLNGGWRLVSRFGDVTVEQPVAGARVGEADQNLVRQLEVGEVLTASDVVLTCEANRPPERYSIAAYLADLEAKGIGSPGSYAAMLTKVMGEYGYLTLRDRRIWPTEIAEGLMQHLDGRFSYMEFDYSAALERDLDAIAAGRLRASVMLGRVDGQLATELEMLAPELPVVPCFECGTPMDRRFRKAPSTEAFWVCQNEHYFDDVEGVPHQPDAPTYAIEACPSCKATGTLQRRNGPSGYYFHCMSCANSCPDDGAGHPAGAATGKRSSQRNTGSGVRRSAGQGNGRANQASAKRPKASAGDTCPVCNAGTIVCKNGRNGTFLGCDQWPRCRYSSN
jgi:DNA topoisomerase-1